MVTLAQEGGEGEACAAGTGDCDTQGAGQMHAESSNKIRCGKFNLSWQAAAFLNAPGWAAVSCDAALAIMMREKVTEKQF